MIVAGASAAVAAELEGQKLVLVGLIDQVSAMVPYSTVVFDSRFAAAAAEVASEIGFFGAGKFEEMMAVGLGLH